MLNTTANAYLLFLILTFVFSSEVQSYAYRGPFDTSDGLCELEFFGKIPVGGKEYNDTRCEEATCHKGYYIVTGCGTRSSFPVGVTAERRPVHYPGCCPFERNEEKYWFCSLCT